MKLIVKEMIQRLNPKIKVSMNLLPNRNQTPGSKLWPAKPNKTVKNKKLKTTWEKSAKEILNLNMITSKRDPHKSSIV